jgi:DNA-binding beta-propeller fold protein YncE
LYVDLEDKGKIAVVDAKTMTMTGSYDLAGKGGTCAGLAIDVKNNILFATCREPQTMVILSAADGTILETLPIGGGTDGAVFNPATMEAFSSQGGVWSGSSGRAGTAASAAADGAGYVFDSCGGEVEKSGVERVRSRIRSIAT